MGYSRLDITETKKLAAHQFSQFLAKLLLPFWKDPLDGDPKNANWFFRMEQHFYGYPIGEIADKCRDQGYA